MSQQHRAHRDWIEREGRWLAVPLVVCVVGLAVLPFSQLVMAALYRNGAWSIETIATLLRPEVWRATRATLEVAVASSVLALGLGTLVALALGLVVVHSRRTLAFLFLLSLMVAPHVAALAFKSLAGPSSPLLNALGIAPAPGTPNPMLGLGGITLVMGLHHAPLVAVIIAAGLARIPKSVGEAAMLDAAGPWRTIAHVVLPLLGPHMLAAALVAFVAGVGNFGIPALLGTPVGIATLPVLVYRRLASVGPSIIGEAAAVSLLVGLIAGAGLWLAARLGAGQTVRLEAGDRMVPLALSKGATRAVEVALWGLVFVAFVLPFAALLSAALVPAFGMRLTLSSATFEHFTEVLLRQAMTRRAFVNSALLSAAAAMIVAGLAVVIAYALDRPWRRWRRAIEPLIELPYALPGVVLAIACILLLLRPLPLLGVSLYATPWIILFAYVARFLPLALKPVQAAMTQAGREPEEAASVCGARLLSRLRFIVLPRLLPAAGAGAAMAFLLAFNELTVSALLWSPGVETLGVALLSLDDAGLMSPAAAIGVSATVLVALLMLALEAIGRWLPDEVLPWRVLAGQ